MGIRAAAAVDIQAAAAVVGHTIAVALRSSTATIADRYIAVMEDTATAAVRHTAAAAGLGTEAVRLAVRLSTAVIVSRDIAGSGIVGSGIAIALDISSGWGLPFSVVLRGIVGFKVITKILNKSI